MVLSLLGCAEIVFGVVLLFVQKKSIHLVNIFVILFLTIGVIFSHPTLFTLPFNPFSLNLLMITGSIIIILNLPSLPKAYRLLLKMNMSSSAPFLTISRNPNQPMKNHCINQQKKKKTNIMK
ncbi:hypothetical protein HOH45_04140 [bacterium]|nr:hypothetical protein [bacterium]